MNRPEWPTGMVLPVEAIHRIRDEQAAYDRDPEGYERRERQRAEERQQEREAEYWQYEQEQSNEQAKREHMRHYADDRDLPF